MNERIYDTVIIGAGPGGMTAASYTARAGLDVLVLEGLIPGGQMGTTFEVENYPGLNNVLSGAELAMDFEGQAKKFGAEIAYERAEKVDFSGEIKVITTDSREIKAKTVVLAMGVKSDKGLYEQIKNMTNVYLVGDADKVGRIANATMSAYKCVKNIK